jgi:hypothetical protein
LFDVLDEQFGLEGIGVVKVDFGALDGRQAAQILVIGIVLEEGYPVWADALEDDLSDGCLARAGAAGNGDDQWRRVRGHA